MALAQQFSRRIIANFRADDDETQSCNTALLLPVFERSDVCSSGFALCVGMESGEDVLVGCAAGGAERLYAKQLRRNHTQSFVGVRSCEKKRGQCCIASKYSSDTC